MVELVSVVEVFRALPQERVQQLVVELVSVVEVFRALPQDRVQQHLVVMMFLSLQVGDA